MMNDDGYDPNRPSWATMPRDPGAPVPPPPAAYGVPPVRAPRRRAGFVAAGIVTAGVAVTAAVVVSSQGNVVTGVGTVGSAAQNAPSIPDNGTGGGFGGSGSDGSGSDGSGSDGSGGLGGQSNGSATTPAASAAQQVGVVDINTVLGYQSARAAGTGMILTSSGEVLTNNHVVRGATKITVTVVSTGKTYQASVVGTDPSDDVAVVQLADASGLQTARLASSSVSVGAQVTAVGNAGGTGGTPSAAAGQVTALDQTITATDDDGSNAEQLTGLIETDANVQAGDSGGPLYNSDDRVVGMDTAASSGTFQTASAQGYAIPIGTAVKIADEIESGQASSTIHIGHPAFLGVSVSSSRFGTSESGAAIAGVVSGTPADQAGLAAGDVITAVGGSAITSGDDLTTALAKHHAGDSVQVTWTDQAGQSHTATVTLIAGPAD
jgi:S1-C subfamily serine protease